MLSSNAPHTTSTTTTTIGYSQPLTQVAGAKMEPPTNLSALVAITDPSVTRAKWELTSITSGTVFANRAPISQRTLFTQVSHKVAPNVSTSVSKGSSHTALTRIV